VRGDGEGWYYNGPGRGPGKINKPPKEKEANPGLKIERRRKQRINTNYKKKKTSLPTGKGSNLKKR